MHSASVRSFVLLFVLGIGITQGQVQQWTDLQAAAKQRVVNIVVIGDSIACCIGPQDYNDVWTNQLRTRLASRFRSHGSGLIPVGNNDGLSMNPQWSVNGSKDEVTTVEFGPYQRGVGAFGGIFRLTGEARLTISPHLGDHANIYYATASDSAGGIQVSSGSTPIAVIGNSRSTEPTAHMASIALPSDGNAHSITLAPADRTSAIYVCGLEFTSGSVGLSLHNVAHGYARSEAWGSDPVRQMAFVRQIPGQLDGAIIALGVNDSVNGMGTTAEEFTRNMHNIVDALRQLNPRIRIVIQDENNTKPGDTVTLFPQTAVRQQETLLASELHLGYISIADTWGTEKQAELKGYMTRDGVHPSDIGDSSIADIVARYLF